MATLCYTSPDRTRKGNLVDLERPLSKASANIVAELDNVPLSSLKLFSS